MLPGATSLRVLRVPKILVSTMASATRGITRSPEAVTSELGMTLKDVTTVVGEIGLWEQASNPTNTLVSVGSACLCDWRTKAAVDDRSRESIRRESDSHRLPSKAIGAASNTSRESDMGRAKFKAATSSIEPPLLVSPCFNNSVGSIQHTSSITVGEIKRGSVSEESFRGSIPPPSPSKVRALDMSEAKPPTIRSASDWTESDMI
mmetsp:Transcript_32463/g.74600  ORF Transcript_32463/g.74600 Transcript_32463/m.74600 type:complete len:205 (-) Transcript_32463:185-799(-)